MSGGLLMGGGAAELRTARAILVQISPLRMFVECRDEIGVAGVGLGVFDPSWIGIYSVARLLHARRQGCARGILDHLLGSATAPGAGRADLAVTEANKPAYRLYEMFGFERRQQYSYVTLDPV